MPRRPTRSSAEPRAAAAAERARELRQIGDNGQVRLVHASQLSWVGMDVHERLARTRHVEQRVAACRDVPQPPANGDDEIGIFDAAGECRIHPNREVAGISTRAVVDVVLATERCDDRNGVRLAEEDDVGTGTLRPGSFADDDERPFGGGEQLPQTPQLLVSGPRTRNLRGGGVVRICLLVEHVLGQGEHDRPRSAGGGDAERPRDVLGDARRVVDLSSPLRHRSEDRGVVELLERGAPGVSPGNLADEEDHRRRVLVGRVHPHRRVRRAGAARHEADSRTARELSVRLGHVRRRRLMTARDKAEESRERRRAPAVALAGDAERKLGAVQLELVDERLAARPGHRSTGCSSRIVARWSFGLLRVRRVEIADRPFARPFSREEHDAHEGRVLGGRRRRQHGVVGALVPRLPRAVRPHAVRGVDRQLAVQ